MSANICREVRREIDQSELGQVVSERSAAHLSGCASCATFSDERTRLRELVGGLPPVSAPPDFEMRLRARIARERDLPKQPFIFRLVMSTPAIVVAAVLVIAVAAIVFVGQMKRPQNTQLASDKGPQPVNTVTGTLVNDHPPEAVPSVSPAGIDDPLKVKQMTAQRTAPRSNAPVILPPTVTDYGVRGAEPVRMIDRAGEVSLNAPANPLVVTMYDEHGTARKIQLPPISFGSQRLTDSRTQVSMTNMKDW